jgi:trimeric autotransporter adhesin
MKTFLQTRLLFSKPEAMRRPSDVMKHTLLLLALSILISAQAQVELIKDINQDHNPEDQEYKEAVDVNGNLFFVSNNELWKSNSKTSGTVLVKKFINIHSLRNVSGVLFFAADNGSGFELWKSAGASYSTVRIKDIAPGIAGSHPEHLTTSGDLLYFVASNGVHGRELWRSDGTSSGTFMVRDILSKGGSSNPSFLTDSGSKLFFAANDGINGYELWRTDGTTAGTSMVKDIRPGARISSAPRHLADVNGTVFFSADNGINGRELWKSDGTAEGTVLVKDIIIGNGSTLYNNLTNVNGTLFFSANDKIHGEELWKSNGTAEGTVMVKDLRPGPKGSSYAGIFSFPLTHFTSVNGKLYFTGYKHDGYYFWKSDGTETGTIAFLPVNSFGIMNVIPQFTAYNGSVFFYNGGVYNDGQVDRLITADLMKEDNNGNVSQVTRLILNDYYNDPNPLLVYSRNLLYLTGRRSPAEGYALFRTAGTSASTKWVADTYVLRDQSSEPAFFLKIGNIIYFTIGNGRSLWKTDGTAEGTQQLIELAGIYNLVNVNGEVYFAGHSSSSAGIQFDIYKTDGTQAGTKKLGFLPPDPAAGLYYLTNANGKLYFVRGSHELWVLDGSEFRLVITGNYVNTLLAAGNILFFRGFDNIHGSELWRSDGTTTGTKMVKDINPSGHSHVSQFTIYQNILYFSATDGVHGGELWRSDGTSNGTYMLKDVRTDDGHLLEDIREIVATDNSIFFTSEDENYNWVLWKSNGTSAGTVKVAAIPSPTSLLKSDNRLYIISYDGSYSLWKSDGTSATTERLIDLTSGSLVWKVRDYLTINGVFYVSFLGEHLWRSDGTTCGTYPIETVNIYPSPIASIGSQIIFSGHDPLVGRELFKVNVNDLLVYDCPGVARFSEGESNTVDDSANLGIRNYPNPFDNLFTLEVTGDENANYEISISDLRGLICHKGENLKYNHAYVLSPGLESGVYILRIYENDKVTVKKLIKR